MTKLFSRGIGRMVAGGGALFFGMPLVLLEVGLLWRLPEVAPHILNKRDIYTVSRLAAPLCLIHLLALVSVLVIAVRSRSLIARVVLCVSLILTGLGMIVLYQQREGLQRAACAQHCIKLVRDSSSVRDLDGHPTESGAFCLFSLPPSKYNGACYVHEPRQVRQYMSSGMWKFVGLFTLLSAVAVNVFISSCDKVPVTHTSQDVRSLYRVN